MFYSLAMEDYTTAFRSNFIIKSTETLFFCGQEKAEQSCALTSVIRFYPHFCLQFTW